MVEPVTTTAIAGGALTFIIKPQIEKLLGPTVEYYGEELRDYFKKRRAQNCNNILEKSIKLLGSRLENIGSISTRIVGHLLTDGSFIENELMQEYYAGIIASSRTNDPIEDRALIFLKLLSEMSHYEIKSHYLFYSKIRDLNLNTRYNIFSSIESQMIKGYVSYNEFETFLGIKDWEYYDKKVLLSDIFFRFDKSALIENFIYGNIKRIRNIDPNTHEGDISFSCSVFGVQFYLWAHGEGLRQASDFFDSNLQLPKIE
jgi:hypothetical protein